MQDELVGKIEAHPRYTQFRQRHNRLSLVLIVLMLAVYHDYIALIVFDKAPLIEPVDTGMMNAGMPVGIAVIVFTAVITSIYVRRVNSEHDQLTQDILKDAVK